MLGMDAPCVDELRNKPGRAHHRGAQSWLLTLSFPSSPPTLLQAKQAVLASGWLPDGLPAHAAASCASGLVATAVSTPADVIKTRLMGQDAARPLYSGPVDCLIKSVRQEGSLALYKG